VWTIDIEQPWQIEKGKAFLLSEPGGEDDNVMTRMNVIGNHS
jgi:hypothetical protein